MRYKNIIETFESLWAIVAIYKEGRNNILQLILTYFKWQFTKQFRFLGLSLFAEKITMAINVCTTIFNISHLIEFVSCSNAYNTTCPGLRGTRNINNVFSYCAWYSVTRCFQLWVEFIKPWGENQIMFCDYIWKS